jgi:hypothetical protein
MSQNVLERKINNLKKSLQNELMAKFFITAPFGIQGTAMRAILDLA